MIVAFAIHLGDTHARTHGCLTLDDYGGVCLAGVQGAQVKEMGESAQSLLSGGSITLQTSEKSWKLHLKTFYKVPQYIGAVIILSGLVVSALPAFMGGSGGGPVQWDLVFFLATIPTALSAVYKQIAFESVDLDVWYARWPRDGGKEERAPRIIS